MLWKDRNHLHKCKPGKHCPVWPAPASLLSSTAVLGYITITIYPGLWKAPINPKFFLELLRYHCLKAKPHTCTEMFWVGFARIHFAREVCTTREGHSEHCRCKVLRFFFSVVFGTLGKQNLPSSKPVYRPSAILA